MQVSDSKEFHVAAAGERRLYRFEDGSYEQNVWYSLQEVIDDTYGWYLFDTEGNMFNWLSEGSVRLSCCVRSRASMKDNKGQVPR